MAISNIDSEMVVGIEQEIISELSEELKDDSAFALEKIKIKVRDAYRKVRSRKAYENTSYTEKQIEQDLYNRYFQDIKDVAMYNYNKIGAEFQDSHSENGVVRTWRTEDEILGNIDAFIKVI